MAVPSKKAKTLNIPVRHAIILKSRKLISQAQVLGKLINRIRYAKNKAKIKSQLFPLKVSRSILKHQYS